MFYLNGNNKSFYDERKRMETEKKVKEVSERCKQKQSFEAVQMINNMLKKVEESIYEVEESEDFTAYGALINGVANCDGITESFGMILSELNIPFEVVSFRDSNLTGIKVDNMIFAPQVEKWCENNDVDFESWKVNHI